MHITKYTIAQTFPKVLSLPRWISLTIKGFLRLVIISVNLVLFRGDIITRNWMLVTVLVQKVDI